MKKIFLSLAVVAGLCSCGSIMNGTKQDVVIASNVSGATVEINGSNRGVTPLTVSLSRADDYTIVLRADGYQDREIRYKSGVSAWLIGNIAFGGLIGIGVDCITGGAYTFDQDEVSNLQMSKK